MSLYTLQCPGKIFFELFFVQRLFKVSKRLCFKHFRKICLMRGYVNYKYFRKLLLYLPNCIYPIAFSHFNIHVYKVIKIIIENSLPKTFPIWKYFCIQPDTFPLSIIQNFFFQCCCKLHIIITYRNIYHNTSLPFHWIMFLTETFLFLSVFYPLYFFLIWLHFSDF